VKNKDGTCPECFEHTTAGDSCCGMGAVVEGVLITDEDVWDYEDKHEPQKPVIH
jgi:hypothetical protein